MSSQLHANKRMKYPPEQMARAIEAVRSNELSKKAAAKAYNVPRTTLLDKLAGRAPEVTTSIGRKPVLTKAEEQTLVRYTKLMFEIGYPLTKRELLKEVKKILDLDCRPTPFKDNLPGFKWFKSFQKRNPEMTMRTPMKLGQERANVNIDMIEGWFTGVKTYLEKEVEDYERLLKNPRRIYNADESGFPLSAKTDKVIAPKGSKNVYQVTTNTKTQITVMAAFNAFGDYVPPLILFPGERLRDVGLQGFQEAMYATTKNGWMTSETFISFLEMLVDHVKEIDVEFPILLFVDGHSTHMSLKAAEFCQENGVILYCLLPNATHVLQACDIGLFGPMKKVWLQTVKDWQIKNIGVAMSKKEFPGLLKQTWDKVAIFENAAHGFRKSGLFPLTVNGIDKSKLAPSKVANPPAAGNETDKDKGRLENHITTQNVESNAENTDRNNAGIEEAKQSTEAEDVVVNQDGATVDNRDTNIAPAFAKLTVPEPRQKAKKVVRLSAKLPKAISGSVAIQMLREREQKKKEDEMAKIKRKEERQRKKEEKEAEKEKKKREREEKQTLKKKNRKDKGRKRKYEMDSDSESDDQYNSSALVDDVDSDEYEEEFQMCPGCNKGDQHPSRWVTCEACVTRWHFMCANRPEFELLDADERKKMEFVCPLCG